jgi:hypothetical protein
MEVVEENLKVLSHHSHVKCDENENFRVSKPTWYDHVHSPELYVLLLSNISVDFKVILYFATLLKWKPSYRFTQAGLPLSWD